MTRETIDRVVDWFARSEIPTIDLTGGAPEMIPDFRYFIEQVKALHPPRHVIDRCNLTILLEPGYDGLAQFLARHKVEVIASMPEWTSPVWRKGAFISRCHICGLDAKRQPAPPGDGIDLVQLLMQLLMTIHCSNQSLGGNEGAIEINGRRQQSMCRGFEQSPSIVCLSRTTDCTVDR